MGATPEELNSMFQSIHPGELSFEELPDELKEQITSRNLDNLIEKGILSVRDVLWALATEVWNEGIQPSYD